SSAILAADIHAAPSFLEIGDWLERDVQAVRSIKQDFFEIPKRSRALGHAHSDVEMLFAFPELCRGFPRQSRLDNVLDVPDVQAITGGASAIDLDQLLWHFASAIDRSDGDAPNIGNGLEHFAGFLTKRGGIVAKDFDHDLAVDL